MRCSSQRSTSAPGPWAHLTHPIRRPTQTGSRRPSRSNNMLPASTPPRSLASAAPDPADGGTSTDYKRLEEERAAITAARRPEAAEPHRDGNDVEEDEEVLFSSPTRRGHHAPLAAPASAAVVVTAGLPRSPKGSESTTPTTPASTSPSSNGGGASPPPARSHREHHGQPSAMSLLGLGSSLTSSSSSSASGAGAMSRMRTASSQEHEQRQAAEQHLSISGGSPATGAGATPRFHHHAPAWFQAAYFVLLGGMFLYFLVDSMTSKKLFHLLERLFGWIEQHYVLGPLAYLSCVIIFSLLCVPESALTVGGGYIFAQAHGVVWGIVLCASLVVVGGITGALLAFLIARYLCFDTVQRWAHRYRLLRAIDRSLVENGLKMVFLLRLSPFLPFNVLNYLMGVTSVTLRDFLLGSFGMLPWVCTCAYIGSALKGVSDVAGATRGEAAHKHRALSYTAYALGAAGTLGVVWLISQYTRRAFAEVLREDYFGGSGPQLPAGTIDGPPGHVHAAASLGAAGYAEMGAVAGDVDGGVEEEEMVFEVEEGRIQGGAHGEQQEEQEPGWREAVLA